SNFELGSSGGTSRPRPVAAPGAQPWTSFLGTGALSQCARLGMPEQVYCWGDTISGSVSMPTREMVLDGAPQLVRIGGTTTCFIASSGRLFCQGDNSNGEYGDDSISQSPTPVNLNRSYTAIASTLYDSHACGVRLDAQVECWGHNQLGQSGETDT